jgi:hypothetical protein
MTLNLTPEEKLERKKRYKKEYAKAYYQYIKANEPEKYKEIIKKACENKMAKYYNNKAPKITKVKINLE